MAGCQGIQGDLVSSVLPRTGGAPFDQTNSDGLPGEGDIAGLFGELRGLYGCSMGSYRSRRAVKYGANSWVVRGQALALLDEADGQGCGGVLAWELIPAALL